MGTSGFRRGPSSRDGPGPALVGGSGDIHANQLPRKELLAACQATTLPRSTRAPLTQHPEQDYLLPNGLTTTPNRQLRRVWFFFLFTSTWFAVFRSSFRSKKYQSTGTGYRLPMHLKTETDDVCLEVSKIFRTCTKHGMQRRMWNSFCMTSQEPAWIKSISFTACLHYYASPSSHLPQ